MCPHVFIQRCLCPSSNSLQMEDGYVTKECRRLFKHYSGTSEQRTLFVLCGEIVLYQRTATPTLCPTYSLYSYAIQY